MRRYLWTLLLAGCVGSTDGSRGETTSESGPRMAAGPADHAGGGAKHPTVGGPVGGAAARSEQGFADPGGQHPPIPADNPVWEWDAGGFVSDAGWYGEHSWADVRMRVAGHISAAGRDRARTFAERGDWTRAASAYADLAQRLDAIAAPREGIARDIIGALQAGAHRDAALLGTLAAGVAPDGSAVPGIAGLRQQYLALAVRHERGESVGAEARALQAELVRHVTVDPSLDLDAFADFDARHALRVALVRAYVDSADPLGLSERWGYWRAEESRRQALVIGLAAGLLGGEDWSWKRSGVLTGELPDLTGVDATLWPSRLARALVDADQKAEFRVDGLGWLPTGDSLIDSGGWPGPRAIGTLQRLGLDDPEHVRRLEEWSAELNEALREEPSSVPERVEKMASELDQYGHGSRFYNIKQLRNAAVRQLARAGHASDALRTLRANRPLHAQDWACPNRDGILLVLEGRLQHQAGELDAARGTFGAALSAADEFLRNVDAAERAPPGKGPGARPPAGPSGGPGAPPRSGGPGR